MLHYIVCIARAEPTLIPSHVHIHDLACMPPRVNNVEREYLTLYGPVTYDCAEVKWLPFRVT